MVCHYDDTLLLLLAGEHAAAAGNGAAEQAAGPVLLLVVAVGVMDSRHDLQQGGCLFRPHQLRQLGQCAPEPERLPVEYEPTEEDIQLSLFIYLPHI